MPKLRSLLHAMLPILLGMLVLSACSQEEDPPASSRHVDTPRSGGFFRIPLSNDPPGLDPAEATVQVSLIVARNLFEGLVRFDDTLMVHPALAASWTAEDGGTAYRFLLREGAAFHDGTPVTAEDVAFSFRRLLRAQAVTGPLPHLLEIEGAEEYRAGSRDDVSGLEPHGDREILIRLARPHAPFLAALGMVQASVVPRHAVEAAGADFARRPVGSGPFRLASWGTDASGAQNLELVRFDDYGTKPAMLDGLRFRVYARADIDKAVDDFRGGRLDILPVFPAIRERLADVHGLSWLHRPTLSLVFYGMNVKDPQLADPALRRIIAGSIDRSRIASQVYGGQVEVARQLLPPGLPGYRPLAEDQVPTPTSRPAGSPRLRLRFVSLERSPVVEGEIAIAREGLAAEGVDLDVRYAENWEEFKAALDSPALQLFRYSWHADMPDASTFLVPLFGTGSPDNFTGYSDSGVDALLDKALSTLDPVERAELYRQAEERIRAAAPVVPLYHLSLDRVVRAGVRGLKLNPLGAHEMRFEDVWIDAPPAQAR